MNKNKISQRTNIELSYLAGFLDGDGCINAQIVKRHDYRLKFQIRVSITFFQKTCRHWVMFDLHKNLGCGTIRKRPDGISEYAIIGIEHVHSCLEALKPYLRIKHKQCNLVLEIIRSLSKGQNLQSFYKSCEMVDKIANLNDSKKRTVTATFIKSFLEPDKYFVPVETPIKENKKSESGPLL